MMLPSKIEKIVKNIPYTVDTVGRSDDHVYIFEKSYVLKVSKDGEMLARERERFDFLSDNGIPGPRSICFVNEGDNYFYLRTYLDGESLIAPRFINNPELLVEALASTVAVLRSLDGIPCPPTTRASTLSTAICACRISTQIPTAALQALSTSEMQVSGTSITTMRGCSGVLSTISGRTDATGLCLRKSVWSLTESGSRGTFPRSIGE